MAKSAEALSRLEQRIREFQSNSEHWGGVTKEISTRAAQVLDDVRGNKLTTAVVHHEALLGEVSRVRPVHQDSCRRLALSIGALLKNYESAYNAEQQQASQQAAATV